MNLRELSVMLAMCLIWGFHFVVIKTAVDVIPPMFYSAIRLTLVAAIMIPFLRWRPGNMLRVFGAGVCFGALNYAFMFTGIHYATASAAAIAIELYVPFATILSIIFLKDRIGWGRIIGVVLAFIGVAILALGRDSQVDAETRIALGVGFVAAGAFVEAVGAVLVKQLAAFRPHELLAWFAVIGSVGQWMMTFVFESGHAEALAAANTSLIVGAVLYSAICASIVGHSAYYWLLQRLPVSVVAPSVLLTTLFAVFFSVLLLGEPVDNRLIIGGLLTLGGVGVVLLRSARKQDITAPVSEPGVGP